MLLLSWLLSALAAPLPLDDVLSSVDAHMPALQAAAAKIDAAEAKLLAARGAFDPTLSGKSSQYGGSDPRSASVLSLGSETMLGPSWEAGIRRSTGSLKPYETELETGTDGEWFARVEAPLDALLLPDSRAALAVASAGAEIAEQAFADKRLSLRYKASAAYWKWAGSGAKRSVEQAQLDLADDRIAALTRQVEEGSAPRMDLVDARRALLERQARVLAAQADLDVAAQILALYYRDDAGMPVIATEDQLPLLDTPASDAALDELLEIGTARRPDLLALDQELEAARVTLRRQQLAMLPDATLIGQVADDRELDKTEWLAGVELKVPLLLRKDRGKLGAAQAEVARLEAERVWLADQIGAQIRNAWTAAAAASAQATLMADAAAQAEEVLQMERRRYELGDTDLFKLLLREDKLAEVTKYLAAAQAEAQIRQAALERVVGAR